MSDERRFFDVTIVGGGPAGLSAALMLGRACRSVAIVDAGKPRNAAARSFHGYLGRDGSNPVEFLMDGRRELSNYDVHFIDDRVIRTAAIEGSGFPTAFRADTASGRSLTSRKLLVATGVTDELPDVPGVKECYGASIHHCPYCDGWEHRGKRLLAYATTSEGAVGLALSLRTWTDEVIALTDGNVPTPGECERLASNGAGIRDRPLRRILHAGDRLEGVEFDDGSRLLAEAMFFNSRPHPSNEIPAMLGCRIENDDTAHVRDKQKTNVPGLYVAGDLAGDVSFVIVAAAEGTRAAVAINRDLQDERHTSSPR